MEFFTLILFLLLILFLILIAFLIIRTSKAIIKSDKFFNKNVWLLSALILVFVIILPFAFTSKYFSNFNTTGQIGDTIGGITSPFINGLAAILVYIAFTEQVKANELVREQQYFQHILNEIQKLEIEMYKMNEIIQNIRNGIFNSKMVPDFGESNEKEYGVRDINVVRRRQINNVQIGKATYLTIVFVQTHEMISKLKVERLIMANRLRLLYIMVYQEYFIDLKGILQEFSTEKHFSVPEADLLFQIEQLENIFKDPISAIA